MRLLDFIFPHGCMACKELSQGRGPLCPVCVEGVELLSYEERCKRCFRKGNCKGCMGEIFRRRGAVFEEGSPMGVLMWDQERFAKTIAALFVVQLVSLRLPLPAAIYYPRTLKPVGKEVAKFFRLPFVSHEPSVICLSHKYEEDEVPLELYSRELFSIAFTMRDC